jgi:hypothetical protein
MASDPPYIFLASLPILLDTYVANLSKTLPRATQLPALKLPARVRVRDVLGTEHHSGGTKEYPSPFPESWNPGATSRRIQVRGAYELFCRALTALKSKRLHLDANSEDKTTPRKDAIF